MVNRKQSKFFYVDHYSAGQAIRSKVNPVSESAANQGRPFDFDVLIVPFPLICTANVCLVICDLSAN